MPRELPEPESRQLQRCVGDLVSIMALSAMWAGRDAFQIAGSLLDAILVMLDLDFAHLQLNAYDGELPLQVTRLSQWLGGVATLERFRTLVGPSMDAAAHEQLRPLTIDGHRFTVAHRRLGLLGETGSLLVGSRRADFPRETEALLLTVAANQATIGLQSAGRLNEQKRLTHQLDELVEARTRELALANKELHRLTETIPQMLWSATPDGRIDYCNARLLDFTGFTADEIIGDGWTRIVHPDDLDIILRAWSNSMTTATPYQVEARLFHAASGSYRWCLTTGLPLRDEAGHSLKWHGACVDLHDWKEAQDELRKTQAELAHITRVMTMGQITASIAHELNQPLAGIIMNAGTALRMLTADPPNIDVARDTARRTIRDAERASEVISRLRALFARRSTVCEVVDINAAMQEVVALSSHELQRNGVGVRISLGDKLPPIIGDRVQIQQVILNLITNGAEATTETPLGRPRELHISTRADAGDHVVVTVKDEGTGFDPDAADKIFTPFYTTKSNGMGVGLSVSRVIVENHQGRLWAEHNDGPGSTFCFSIPARQDT